MEFISQLPNIKGGLIYDTHCHYFDNVFKNDIDQLIPALNNYGVGCIILSSTSEKDYEGVLEIAQKYSYTYITLGIHPEYAHLYSDIDWIEKNIDNPKVVAVGEIGLDYHYRQDNRIEQQDLFKRQIELALKHDMPIVVHDRDAHADTMKILQEYKPKGTVHCYSGSVEMAKELVKLGMNIGIGGVVTFKNARKTVEVVEQIPLESIVLETDAPYLAPTPFRGKRNHSGFISLVAQQIGDIKGISTKEVLDITAQNSRRIYNVK